jgi:NAD(P)H dehydrogenase (quinone)
MVLDHPYAATSATNVPHRRSFTAAVAAAAIRGATAAGHEVDLIDLAADRFNPAMTAEDLSAWRQESVVDPQVADYQRRLLQAEHLVFAFPIWWESMPATTKGFLDRVLTKGLTFEEVEGTRGNPFRSLLPNLRTVTVLTVMTTPDKAYRWWFGKPAIKILLKGTFGKIGVKDLRWTNYASVDAIDDAARSARIAQTEAVFAGHR